MSEIPPYVTCLIDAYVTGLPLNFRGHEVPPAVQERLLDEVGKDRLRMYAEDTVETAYEPSYWGEQAPERGYVAPPGILDEIAAMQSFDSGIRIGKPRKSSYLHDRQSEA